MFVSDLKFKRRPLRLTTIFGGFCRAWFASDKRNRMVETMVWFGHSCHTGKRRTGSRQKSRRKPKYRKILIWVCVCVVAYNRFHERMGVDWVIIVWKCESFSKTHYISGLFVILIRIENHLINITDWITH